MTTIDPTDALQLGIWRTLKTDPTVSSLMSAVLDAEPERQSFPYVVVDAITSIDDSTHDNPGRRVDIGVHTWVKGDVRGRHERPDNVVGARVVSLFDRAHKTLNPLVEGHKVWMTRVVESRRVPDTDRTLRHRLDTVRVWTSQDM